MNDKKVLLFLIVTTALILSGGLYFLSSFSTPAVEKSASAQAESSLKSYDFGEVSYNGENVVKDFEIKNNGTEDLKIFNIRTSCHCTRAVLIVDGKESENFGMGTVSSWIGIIKPGNKSTLRVKFDPKYHGIAGVGPVSRYVSLETNSQKDPNLTFSLTGLVFK